MRLLNWIPSNFKIELSWMKIIDYCCYLGNIEWVKGLIEIGEALFRNPLRQCDIRKWSRLKANCYWTESTFFQRNN